MSPEGSEMGSEAMEGINPEGQGAANYFENQWQRERRQKREKAKKAEAIRQKNLEERRRHFLQEVPPMADLAPREPVTIGDWIGPALQQNSPKKRGKKKGRNKLTMSAELKEKQEAHKEAEYQEVMANIIDAVLHKVLPKI